jgi:cobalt-precorrin 5A hydrolase
MVGDQVMSARIAVGVGCRLGCSASAIEALVRQALGQLPLDRLPLDRLPLDRLAPDRLALDRLALDRLALDRLAEADRVGLFTIRDKAGESGLHEAARRLGLDLVFLTPDALRQQTPRLQTRSQRVEHRFGVPSVAEAAALAGAGAHAELIVPRITGPGATCAVAGSRD